jgi:hypothetical protein
MTGHLYVMKQIQNQMKCSTPWFLNKMLDLQRLNFLTAEQILISAFELNKYSSCCTPIHSSLCTHSSTSDGRQRGDSSYSRLFFESSVGRLKLILHSGHGPNVADYPQTVWLLSVFSFNLYVCVCVYNHFRLG